MRAVAAILLFLAACGDGVDNRATTEQLQRISTPKVETPDPQATVRSRPLKAADLLSMPVPVCAFGRDGRMLLAVTAGEAIARVDGRLLHLAQSAPLRPSGGFFENRQISISVGRIGETTAEVGSWPARMTITNRRAEAQIRYDGAWRCYEVMGNAE
jgi:hypothetical protein